MLKPDRTLLSILLLLLTTSLAQAQDARRPNVLFLFADDQRPDTIHALGNDHIETPHIDGLVREGFSFTANHCMGSRHGAVCAPSRAMLMSGRTLHRVKDSLEGVVTLGETLGASGYQTFGTGKWHNGRPSFQRSFHSGHSIMFGGMSDHWQVPVVDMAANEMGFVNERKGERISSELFAEAAIDFLEGYAEAQDGSVEEVHPAFVDLSGRERKADRHQPEWIRKKYFGE